MRIKTYNEAVRLARSAGEDAANRRSRKAGRKAWSEADRDHAAETTQRILTDLGFDIASWIATAGLPRNEPPDPPRKKPKRRKDTPVQLSFGFV